MRSQVCEHDALHSPFEAEFLKVSRIAEAVDRGLEVLRVTGVLHTVSGKSKRPATYSDRCATSCRGRFLPMLAALVVCTAFGWPSAAPRQEVL